MIEVIISAGASLIVAAIIGVGSMITHKLGAHGERIAKVEAKVDMILRHVNGKEE